MIPIKHKTIFALTLILVCLHSQPSWAWGFYGHKFINRHAIFLLPPEMMVWYKKNIDYITNHAVDPDKRRNMLAYEGPRHYLDIDHYGKYPYPNLPRRWSDAVQKYTQDTLQAHGIVPWWIQVMQQKLTQAFKDKDAAKILKISADIGHYIADAHVPLHASSNHNGQLTGQQGIHGFWESSIPELLAEKEWDFFIGPAEYIKNPLDFTWKRLLESAIAADTVLSVEKALSLKVPADQQYSFKKRNGKAVKQYSTYYTILYNKALQGMVERRMQQSIYAVACFWYTAWVNAGQPNLSLLSPLTTSNVSNNPSDSLDVMQDAWQQTKLAQRVHEEDEK